MSCGTPRPWEAEPNYGDPNDSRERGRERIGIGRRRIMNPNVRPPFLLL